jgi:hypothetical protein
MKESKIWKKFSTTEKIETLAKEYHEQYPHLKPDHVKALTIKIIHLITNPFGPYRENWSQLSEANIMQEAIIREFTEEEREHITQSCLGVYFFSRGNENGILRCFDSSKLTPENPKDYQDLCKQITREQVTIITNYFLNSLSHSDKILFGRSNSYQDIENTQNGSFVSKVGGSKKSVSFVAGIVNNERNLGPKKLSHDSLK